MRPSCKIYFRAGSRWIIGWFLDYFFRQEFVPDFLGREKKRQKVRCCRKVSNFLKNRRNYKNRTLHRFLLFFGRLIFGPNFLVEGFAEKFHNLGSKFSSFTKKKTISNRSHLGRQQAHPFVAVRRAQQEASVFWKQQNENFEKRNSFFFSKFILNLLFSKKKAPPTWRWAVAPAWRAIAQSTMTTSTPMSVSQNSNFQFFKNSREENFFLL